MGDKPYPCKENKKSYALPGIGPMGGSRLRRGIMYPTRETIYGTPHTPHIHTKKGTINTTVSSAPGRGYTNLIRLKTTKTNHKFKT